MQIVHFIIYSAKVKDNIIITQSAHHNSAIPPKNISPAVQQFLAERHVILFTFDKGVILGYSVHLYCDQCNTNFHHNYTVKDGVCTYYSGVPEFLQAGEHHFVERKLVNLWIHLILTAWTSASACTDTYNEVLAQPPLQDWPFSSLLRPEHVWDAFTLLCLMEDYERRKFVLQVPHSGDQKYRFSDATSCVVTNGMTIRYPCCAVHNCKVPLTSRCDRFCLQHKELHKVCSIIGCDRAIVTGSKVCSDQTHISVEKAYNEHGQSHFQLQQRLRSVCIASAVTTTGDPNDKAAEEDFNVDAAGNTIPATTQFGQKRTHNKQIIVAPCGVIIARTTFFGAKGVRSVAEFIKQTYRSVPFVPDHVFYNNNCHMKKSVANDPFFDHIALTVDVFHFKSKHSSTDLYYQSHCNLVDYSELLGEDGQGWFFNSSIAEQTNAWLANYLSICHEMHRDRFNFFLDEMIIRQNRSTVSKLRSQDAMPDYWSADMFE
ncbi:uncharacterized protein PHACADRAFT_165508 [Phanerochaete carnosa HHB-10118-sp]|uniref:CxC6 like cysteine cluster associated with KDZ domain-containing protein n=1 Tax=Phanerochaete carnosa (strain HHB-10118-sp) TaxID=650164 RepID=K5VW97_PHACS|nr:uncharacterized protein PHACADRAFT_165508 [Phanerochaete carnosa HHB-10118-sp]EKM50854.1 hypothetical protein PHACADRAFT_165508 [Phanerochaete carnosa HHB-10118-sp]